MDPTVWAAIIAFIVGPAIGYLIRRRELIDARNTNAQLSNELAKAKKAVSLPLMLEREAYGILIERPAEYGNVTETFTVSGTFQSLPEGQEIWTSTFDIHRDKDGRIQKRYWPQERATISITSDGKKWVSLVHNIGGRTQGEAKEFLVLVVGIEGQSLFQYFKEAGTYNRSWPAINQLTTDVVLCAIGKVTYDPE